MDVENTIYSLAVMDVPNITGVRQLTEDEFNKFREYITILSKLSFDEGLFQIVELNYEEFALRMEHLSDPSNQIEYFKSNRVLLNTNRLVLNFLSSTRMYLDHMETRLKRKYGNDSKEYIGFKKETSHAYDNNFAYRFLYKLRNYTQHCGLPARSFQMVDQAESNSTFKLFLSKKELLEQFDSWSLMIKKELETLDHQFDIVPLIESKFLLLKEINRKMNTQIYEGVKYMATELLDLMWETKKIGGVPCLIEMSGPEESPILNVQHLPFDVISKITGIEIRIHTPNGIL